MKVIISLLILAAAPITASAQFYIDPHGAVGYNPAQGTYYMLGLDAGFELGEHLRGGLHGYYAAGEEPKHDREYGYGPFVSFAMPFTSFLVGQLRQELNYVNLHDPYQDHLGETIGHTEEDGIASATTAALHLFFTRNLVLSGGYRFVVGISNDALDDGRSGAFVGLSLGF